MPNILAMSFEGQLSPAFTLHCLDDATPRPDGWGIGYYGRGEFASTVYKEATPPQSEQRPAMIKGLEKLSSNLFVLHVRDAKWGSDDSLSNTQPFSRSWRGRDWIFAHGGSMRDRLEMSGDRIFEPVGSTDSEIIFCELMNRIADRRWRSLGYADFGLLYQWFHEFNEYGEMSCILSDGRDVVIYADKDQDLFQWNLRPPYGDFVFRDREVEVDLTARGVNGQKGVIVASHELAVQGSQKVDASRIAGGSLVVLREGEVRTSVDTIQPGPDDDAGYTPAVIVRPRMHARPTAAPPKTFDVRHRTAYRYDNPIENSAHMIRLTPVQDDLQQLLEHEIKISVDGRQRHYKDVFGNEVRKLLIEDPYSELIIEAISKVRVLDTDPLSFRPLHARTTIPLVWMPWQRHMLTPYLLPPELPETQLLELIDYATAFVRRNDYDIFETLMDINATIYRDYQYLPGSTNVFTTAWQVYEGRKGVCQDFTNLFICLARLLGVPARYTCGYIYTGPKNPNIIQSEASHAWVQLYLPEVGWKGFDPTNGILTQTDHIRTAVGRNYIDATPTSGTIYVGGGVETLEAQVWVEPVGDGDGDQESLPNPDSQSAPSVVTDGASNHGAYEAPPAPDDQQSQQQSAQRQVSNERIEGTDESPYGGG